MAEPEIILDTAFQRAIAHIKTSLVDNDQIKQQIEYVARTSTNRAGVRLLMACLLAKLHRPEIDIRKPYTEIGEPDAFSGRSYDEKYITAFINKHNLPCNSTTAFLTPALRNRNLPLTPDLNLVGRPPLLYQTVLSLLDAVHKGIISAEILLIETIRWLLIRRDEDREQLRSLIGGLRTAEGDLPLSSEDIVTLIEQHLKLKGTSRLPVLLIAAAYVSAQKHLGERILTLYSHTAADAQTGALGDVEITLADEDEVVTTYEMKNKVVTREDIDRALLKVVSLRKDIDNYIFITTHEIDESVLRYARSLYRETGGIEFVILDCIGFIRHFLHLFHRVRGQFLETYQALLLEEPESSVSQAVKVAFLAMRQTAELGTEG